MMIPGILAQRRASIPAAFPEIVAHTGVQQLTPATSHTVTLPAGWSAGQLCVIVTVVSAANTTALDPAGWTRVSRYAVGSPALTCDIVWRILQSGDTGPVFVSTSSGRRASRLVTFAPGTFNASSPVIEAATAASGTSGTTLTVNAGTVSQASANYLQMNVLARAGVSTGASITAYPLASNQGDTTTGQPCAASACFAEFTGGTTPGGSWTVSQSCGYRAPVLLIKPA